MDRTSIPALSIEARMSSYYWLYFGAIGSFAPFAALWFSTQNISSTMSGAIFAMPSFATVVFTIFIGGWADRLADWRSAIIICNWIALIAISLILFRQGPWDLLFIWAVSGLFSRASEPIMDAAVLNSAQRTGSDYGRIRSFGSMGFVVGVLLAGWIFNHFGIHWFVTVLVLGAVVRVIAGHTLPAFKSEKSQSRNSGRSTLGLILLRHPGIFLVLIGSALINASHGFNNVFSVMHWTSVGISTGMASALWSVSVVAEVALMWSFKSVAKKFSPRKCLLVASAVCVARWLLAGNDPSVGQLLFLQALHSITFGLTFLATVNFISRRVKEDHAAQAQSEYSMLMTLFIAVAIWSSGWLYGQFGGHTYWAMSVMALLGGACVALSFRTDLDNIVSVD